MVVPAAFHGRVESLFVAVDCHVWGRFDPEGNSAELHDGGGGEGEDLSDFAAIHTILNRGTVYTMPQTTLPEACLLGAVLRY